MRCLALLLGLLPASLFGCSSDDRRLAVFPVRGQAFKKEVSGTLTPLKGAKLVFVPLANSEKFMNYPSARTEADGAFRLGTYGDFDGAPEGEYIVTVEWKDRGTPKYDVLAHGETDRGPDKLNGKYANAATSTLRATIVAGKNLSIHIPAP